MTVYVIGGGAAGLLASYFAAKAGNEVELLEKNQKTGRKIYITGKGRCNLTNDCPFDEFIDNVVSNKKFLYGALRSFSPQDTVSFFKGLNLPLKTERGNRVFPVSEKASDVNKVLVNALERLNVKISLNETVKDIVYSDGLAVKIITNLRTIENPDRVIIACGGVSYKGTGSTGDGYTFAKKAGHTIVPLVPALTTINLSAAYSGDGKKIPMESLPSVEGTSLKNIEVKAIDGDKFIKSVFGEMVFTDKGVSGPVILTLSSYINRLDFKKLKFVLDLKPALDEKTLDDRLIRELSAGSNKILKNVLPFLLPAGLVPFVAELSGIDRDKKMNSVTKEERSKLLKLLKSLTFEMHSVGDIEGAVITAGGVDVKEVNPKNMRSKLIGNLAFAGEVLDVDALTGGFNLQIAFSTGFLAGSRIND